MPASSHAPPSSPRTRASAGGPPGTTYDARWTPRRTYGRYRPLWSERVTAFPDRRTHRPGAGDHEGPLNERSHMSVFRPRPGSRLAALASLSAIALSSAALTLPSYAASGDRDHDGMPNRWEDRHGL